MNRTQSGTAQLCGILVLAALTLGSCSSDSGKGGTSRSSGTPDPAEIATAAENARATVDTVNGAPSPTVCYFGDLADLLPPGLSLAPGFKLSSTHIAVDEQADGRIECGIGKHEVNTSGVDYISVEVVPGASIGIDKYLADIHSDSTDHAVQDERAFYSGTLRSACWSDVWCGTAWQGSDVFILVAFAGSDQSTRAATVSAAKQMLPKVIHGLANPVAG